MAANNTKTIKVSTKSHVRLAALAKQHKPRLGLGSLVEYLIDLAWKNRKKK